MRNSKYGTMTNITSARRSPQDFPLHLVPSGGPCFDPVRESKRFGFLALFHPGEITSLLSWSNHSRLDES